MKNMKLSEIILKWIGLIILEFEELINMIESPCNDVCTTDPESGLCIGCGRTVDEISNWLYYSDKQKKKVIKDLKNRNNIDS